MSDLLTDEEFMGSASPTPSKLLNDDEFMGIDAPDKSVPFGSVARGFNRLQQSGNVLLNEAGVISDESAAKAIARDEADIAKYPTSPTVKQGLKEIAGAEGWGDTIWTILKNPSTVASIVGESLPMSAAAQVAGTLGGVGGSTFGPGGTTAGLAGGTFAASFATEYSSTILDTMQAAGVDLSDPKAVGKAFADDKLMAEARARGVKRGIPVGAFDALSFGIAGKFAKAIEGGAETISTLRRGLAEAAEVGAQGAAGASGEAGAQIADKGKIVSASDVLLEAAGEIAASPAEIAIGQTRNSEQPSAQAGAGVAGGVDASAVTEGAGGPPPPSAPSRDTLRLDSPRLTHEDRASPLPNDLIDDGKKIFEDALGKKAIDVPTSDIATPSMRAEAERRAADIATPAGQAAPSAIERTIEGTLTPAEAASAPGAAPARLLSDREFIDGVSTVDEAAHAAATSPQNALPEPTQAQKEAGNYSKGHTTVGGLDVSIENPQGSTRSGVDPNGKPWSQTMESHYGYIKGTVGKDKDHIDVFVKPGTPSEMADDAPVFVVDQKNDKGGFDEHKILMGFATQAEADAGYHANYQKGWKGAGAITPTTLGEFKAWLATGDTTKPFAEPEKIESAAIRTKDGKIHTGSIHAIIAERLGSSETDLATGTTGLEDGFVTSEGRFVDRAEAARIDKASRPEPAAQTALKQKIKAKRERAPLDLVQFLASEGGIVDHKGEIASLGMKNHFVPGIGKLMRATGMNLDRAREIAEEAGYIGKAGDYQTTTVADLLDALDKNVRGQRVYAREDAGRAQNRAAEKAAKTDSEEQARQDDFDQMVKEFDLNDAETKQIQAAVERGEWASEAIGDILERRAIASESKTRKSRTQKEPSVDDIPFDIGPAPKAGESAADASSGRKGPDAGRAERPAPAVEQPAKAERAGRAEEGGKGQSALRPTLDRQRGINAYRNMSFTPEKRADSDIRAFDQHMTDLRADLSALAKTPEQQAILDADLDRYRDGYVTRQNMVWDSKSRTASPMITGPARFPVDRNRKAMDAEQKRVDEFLDWQKKAEASIRKKLAVARTEEQVQSDEWTRLKKEFDFNIRVIREVDSGQQKFADRRTFVEGIRNRIERRANNGEIALARQALDYIRTEQAKLSKPIFTDGNAIWQVAERGEKIAAAKPTGTETIAEFDGVTVVDNHEAERVQILFDERPSREIADELKKSGWRWSPSNSAWQRQNTANARYSATSILKRHFQPVEAKPAEAPVPTVETGADNKPQTVIPGAERISEAAQAQREADKPMRPKVPQKDAGELFDGQARSERQDELFKARPDTIQPTDAFKAQAQAIGKRLRAELDRLGLKDIGLRISENLGMMVEGKMHAADGQYFQKLITIALDAENPDATLAHEAIHALRELSLFGKDEWAILERQSRKKWMEQHKIAEAYGAFPEWVQVEEGIAHAYGEWSRQGSGFDGIIVKAFRKIKAVLRAIARSFGKDFTSAEDVFAKIDIGEVGSRPGKVEFLQGGPMFQAAYHGTPHDFDKFSLDHIGKGEGAQAFGYGLYFAGKKEIAEYYRDKLAKMHDSPAYWEGIKLPPSLNVGEQERYQELGNKLRRNHNMSEAELTEWRALKDKDRAYYDAIEAARPKGKLFKVDLPEDNELMLWDAPLAEQPDAVKKALGIDKIEAARKKLDDEADAAVDAGSTDHEALYKKIDAHRAKGWEIVGIDPPYGSNKNDDVEALTGQEFYEAMINKFGLKREGADRLASEALRERGIPGHRYLDNTSRNRDIGQTYNYVIYDDSRVKVQEKFALRRAAAAPAPAQRRTTPPISILPSISTLTNSVSTRIMNAIKGGPGKNDGESIGDYSMRKIVDYLHPLREMIDSVGPVADRVNAYLEARLALDSAVASIQDMHGKFVTPAVEALTQAGASLDQLHQYLYALHAEERNRVVGLRNEPGSDFFKAVTDLNTVGASGWSTNHARQVLRQLRVDPQKFAGIQQAGRLVRQMLDENLLAQKNAGLISDASYASLSQQWQNYVPLQAEDGIDENGDFSMPGRGRGFDVRGKEFKGATGRFTEAENIPAWAISATERSKLRQAKNRVGKSILRFINQYDPMGTNLAEVYWSDAPAGGFGNIQKAPPVYKRELDASGKVVNKAVPYSTIAPDMYAAKVAGKTFYIKFADEKVGQALKNMNAVQMHFLLRASRLVTNLQSLVNTRLNPEFVAKNFFRDLMTGIIHLEGFSGRETAKTMGDIPSAFAAVWRNARGRPGAGPMDQALAELTKAGGRIIFEQQRTVEDSIKALHKQMAAASAGNGSPKALWEGFKKLVGDINDTVEMGIRLSAYAGMRAKGQTVKQAALATRDLTVDFRKHGEMGPTGNALYAFFNASVQGNFNVGKRLIKSRRAQIAAGTIMLSGFMMDVLNRSLSGDDDDGENLYEKMLKNEPWKFERQMVLFYGPSKGSYFTIPLPFGYNAVYYTGLQGSAALHGTVAPMEAISSSIRVMVDAFNPMGGGGGWINMFSPTAFDPFLEIDRNKNFADIPIYPTTYPGDTTPDSQQSFGNTPDVFKWAAEQINAATGGNKIEPGAVDIHPDTIEHMWDFVSGGLGRFFGQVADPLVKASTGRADEIAVEKLPFVRSFYGEQGDDNKRSEYYNKREAVQTAKSRLSDYKAAGDVAETQDFIERNKIDVESIPAFDAAEKRLRKIRKARRRIEAEGGDTKALDEAERKAMDAARMAYAKNSAKQR